MKTLLGDKDTLTSWMGAVDVNVPMLLVHRRATHDLSAVAAGLTPEHNSSAVGVTVDGIEQLTAVMYEQRNQASSGKLRGLRQQFSSNPRL